MTSIPDHGWSAAETDWPENPFVRYVTLENRDKLKIALMSLLIAPVRLVMMSATILTAYFLALATLFNMDPLTKPEPIRGWRRKGKAAVAKLFVFAHFFCGFHRIKVSGKRADPWEAPILVFAPHSSVFDALPVAFLGAPSFVGKIGLLKIPFISTIFTLTQPIMVNRESKDSRKSTVEQIRHRAKLLLDDKDNPDGPGWSQVAIFPEGTCTNRTQLVAFKPGAFVPQLPVQPVCLRWPNKLDTVTWTWEGQTLLQSFWYSLCQLSNNLEIEFLPVYIPSEDEKLDPALYARNVREKMAQCLNLPTSDYALDDHMYLTSDSTPQRKRFWQLCEEFRLTTSLCDEYRLYDSWKNIRNMTLFAGGYHVNYTQFAQFVHTKSSEKLQRLFNVFDWQCRGQIDIREFIIAQHADARSYGSLKLCFEIFSDSRDTMSEENFVKVFRIPYEMSVKRCKKLYAMTLSSVNNNTSKINAETLISMASVRPEVSAIVKFEDNNNLRNVM